MAELAAGPHATGETAERARRQDRLQRAEATYDPLPFDGDAGQSVWTRRRGDHRDGVYGTRPWAIDLLIAATALAANLPLYTRNVDDFRGIAHLLTIVGI